jgi:hypothetical protein
MPAVSQPLWLDHPDGQSVYFQPKRIQRVIEAAGLASGEFGEEGAEMLANTVLGYLPKDGHVRLDKVQDQIEQVLMKAGYPNAARLCILFHALCESDQPRPALLQAMDAMNTYLSASR